MKKLLAILLAAVMLIGTLAACGTTTPGSDATPATEGEKEADAGEEAPAASGDKVKISIYRCMYSCSTVDEEQDKKVQDKLNQLLADRGSNVEIELHQIVSGDYAEKANNALLEGSVNILWNSSWWGTINTDNIWRNNGAYDITELVKGTPLWESMPEGVWQASMYDGKILFIPVYKETYEGYDLKTRKALVEEKGWDPAFPDVKWVADIEPYLAEITDLKYPYNAGGRMFYRYYLDYYDAFSGESALCEVDRETNEVVAGLETEKYKEYVHLMASWADKGYISPDEITGIESGMNKTQNWGFGWWTCVPGDELKNSEARDEQEEVIIEGITGKWTHSTTTLGSCYTITANCSEEQAKAAIEFLGYLYTDTEIADLYTFGIEGEDYVLNEDGRVVMQTDSMKYMHQAWESTSVVPLTLLDSEPEDKVASYIEKNEAADTSCAAGFRFDKTPVEAQWTACTAITDEIGKPLELGGYSEDKVDATIEDMVSQLYAAGFQEVFDEATRQYNEWKDAQ
jgi:putative aldouronate transport system substrate-binding protein